MERDTTKSFLNIQVNEYILSYLLKKYNKLTLTKKELGDELNLSVRTITTRLSLGTLPIKYKKHGETKQAPVVFPLVYVAEYLTNEIYQHDECHFYVDGEIFN